MLVAYLAAQLVKNLPAMWETWVWSLGWEDPLKKGKSYPLQYSGLENSMDYIVHRVSELDMTERLSLSLYNSDLNTLSLTKKSSTQKNPEREKIKQYN